jgi:hypothetical protein
MALGGHHIYLAMGFSPVKAAEERIVFDSFRSSFIMTLLFSMVLCKTNYKYQYWSNWPSAIILSALFIKSVNIIAHQQQNF